MASFDLASDELTLAIELLETAYRDLKEEVYKTEDFNYKQQLKERERLIRAIIDKLSGAAGTTG